MPVTFANTIDGNDIYAKRAECDAAGNDLSTTYATKSELPDGVPAVTSSDNNKVLKASYSGGTGSYSWQTESGGGGGGGSYTAGTGIDITNDVISVDTSVVATQTDLADKEDAFDVGTGLEMDTSGATPTLQVEAPVDIVAGPGIVIDNPDGNTLRVSQATNYEVELYKHNTVAETNVNGVFPMSEPITNFERIRIEFWNREFQYHRISFEYFVTDAVADSTQFIAALDASLGTSNIQRVNMAVGFNAAGNLVDKGHGLFYGNGSSYTNGSNRGLGIHRVVGIHRIASN